MSAPDMKKGPDAVTSEPLHTAFGASVQSAYQRGGWDSKRIDGRALPESVAYRDATGRTWRYRGKRGRVLAMLASSPAGVTQWDTLPWHTRLGGTIHALRRDGLEISSELEGEFRHARYRLHMSGSLIIQPDNSEAAA